MSLAEKQLEAGLKASASKDSLLSEASKISDKSSVYQSVMYDNRERGDASSGFNKSRLQEKADEDIEKGTKSFNQSSAKSSVASTASLSSSTHAALIDEITKDLRESCHVRMSDDVVKELRELSALETYSFEEESRFLLTSSLFRFLRSFIPSFSASNKKNSEFEEDEERVFDEISEVLGSMSMDNKEFIGPDEDPESEETAFKLIRFIAFAYVFIFWPSGIARRNVPNQPLRVFKKEEADNKPTSLLQLVSKQAR